MKKFLILLVTAILCVSVVGCKKEKEATGEKDASAIEPPKPIVYYAPLTGEVVKEEVSERAVAVMINNHTKARPQSGISQADMIYEILAEGDITRWLAIFQSNIPDKIGPIRSAREYYIKIAAGYNAYYICHGQSPTAQALLDAGAVDSLNGMNYDGTYFHRDNTRHAPHNSYSSKEDILAAAEKMNVRMKDYIEPNVYSEEGISTSESIVDMPSVKINYSGNDNFKVLYTYDAAKNGYVRSQGGQATIDRENDKTIVASNVFIVKADHNVVDSYGRRSIGLEKGGQGYLLQNGKMLEVDWVNENGRLVPMKNGEVVPYIAGQTWINVVENKDRALTFAEQG